MGIVEAYEMYQDGELSLGDLGEVLLEEGSEESKYPIPVNYFGLEE